MGIKQVAQVHQTTKELFELVFNKGTSDRAVLIDEINLLVKQRETEINALKSPYTEEAMALGQDILKMNQKIEEEMQLIFSKLKKDISLVKKRQQTSKKYINPYGNMRTIEGVYLDMKE